MRLLERIVEGLPEGAAVEAAVYRGRGALVRCGGWGVASVFSRPGEDPGAEAERLIGLEGKRAAARALSGRLAEASWGMAAVNALLDPSPLELVPLNAAAVIAREGRGRRVAAVGAFPFLAKLRGGFAALDVVDFPPWRGEEGVETARPLLARAEVVAVTGSSFINHTAERLLECCRRAYVVVLGPTTPLTPLLFDYGADAVCGTVVSDPARAAGDVAAGISLRRAGGLTCVTAFRERRPRRDRSPR